MIDLVKNLRHLALYINDDLTEEEDITKAADLIEQLQQRITELTATVEWLREELEIDVCQGFYDGYVLGATNERDGIYNHLKLLPEVAEECANKYVKKYANKIKAGDL